MDQNRVATWTDILGQKYSHAGAALESYLTGKPFNGKKEEAVQELEYAYALLSPETAEEEPDVYDPPSAAVRDALLPSAVERRAWPIPGQRETVLARAAELRELGNRLRNEEKVSRETIQYGLQQVHKQVEYFFHKAGGSHRSASQP